MMTGADEKMVMKGEKYFATPEVIKMQCDIHPWMNAYARAFGHPYATLTLVPGDAKDGKYGTYEIKNVPAGKVKVFAWHEKAGYLGKGAGGEEVTLPDGPNTKDFTATAK